MSRGQVTFYLSYFGLREAPFKILPTTEFFYGGGRRGEILNALLYAINVGEGIMMVTGEVGSGKTMLLRTLLEKLEDNTQVIYITNPSLSGREILYNICEELGLKAEENRSDTVRLLQNYLIDARTRGNRVVAFIDEAQAMPDESLEEIRLLSNLETSRDKLLQILLFGQPELEDKISRQEMRQLRERITVKLQLQPFGKDDVREYITTRLHAAGYNGDPIFNRDACRLIAVVSQGLSRRINVLADKAMLSAYSRSALKVGLVDVKRAAKDVNFGKMRYRSEQSRRVSKQLTIGITVAACVLLFIVANVRYYGGSDDVAVAATTIELTTADVVSVTVAVAPSEAEAVVEEDVMAQTAADLTLSAETRPEEDMVAVIMGHQAGERFSGESLAQELAKNAEPHVETPQTSGGDASWQAAVKVTPGVVVNKKWEWLPASSYVRNRLSATEEWLKDTDQRRYYTARLLTVGQERAVFLEKFLRYFADFYPIRNTMVYPLELSDGKKFVVTYGIYSTQSDAEIFLGNIPYYFTGGRPFAQKLEESHGEALSAWQSQ